MKVKFNIDEFWRRGGGIAGPDNPIAALAIELSNSTRKPRNLNDKVILAIQDSRDNEILLSTLTAFLCSLDASWLSVLIPRLMELLALGQINEVENRDKVILQRNVLGAVLEALDSLLERAAYEPRIISSRDVMRGIDGLLEGINLIADKLVFSHKRKDWLPCAGSSTDPLYEDLFKRFKSLGLCFECYLTPDQFPVKVFDIIESFKESLRKESVYQSSFVEGVMEKILEGYFESMVLSNQAGVIKGWLASQSSQAKSA